MKQVKKFEQARAEADDVREVTLEEAKALPGMLGRIADVMLRQNGWYGYRTDDGQKHMLVLK